MIVRFSHVHDNVVNQVRREHTKCDQCKANHLLIGSVGYTIHVLLTHVPGVSASHRSRL